MVWAWVAGAAVVLFVMLLSSNVKCRLEVVREKNRDDIVFDVHLFFGIIKKRLEIPFVQFKNLAEGVGIKAQYKDKAEHQVVAEEPMEINKRTIKEVFESARELLTHCFQFNQWLNDTLKHVRCTRVLWKTEVGVGDAAETAMTAGMVWGLKSSLLGVIFRFIRLEARPELLVNPWFNQTRFSTELLLLTQIRMFYIMLAGLHLLYRIVKVKNGLKTWQRVLFKI